MTQRVRTQVREPEEPQGQYEELYNEYRQKREQVSTGAVVVRSKDAEWEVGRQAKARFFSHPRYWQKQAAPGWLIFEQDIVRHSGKHVHQGGLAIFVLEGKGYTIVDGTRFDWQKGDLILLPVKPGGCEHQHFNSVEGESCRWIALIYRPLKEGLGHQMEQRELGAAYQER